MYKFESFYRPGTYDFRAPAEFIGVYARSHKEAWEFLVRLFRLGVNETSMNSSSNSFSLFGADEPCANLDSLKAVILQRYKLLSRIANKLQPDFIYYIHKHDGDYSLYEYDLNESHELILREDRSEQAKARERVNKKRRMRKALERHHADKNWGLF